MSEASLQISSDASFLRRELQLLRNELSFERYLKQQHAAAISQLKRERIKAVTVEAETATLINANRSLQKRLNDVSKVNEKMQRETQARKIHTKQSEDQLTAKMRALRASLADQGVLEARAQKATQDIEQLRQLLVESELREVRAREELVERLKENEALQKELEETRTVSQARHQPEQGPEATEAGKNALGSDFGAIRSVSAMQDSDSKNESSQVNADVMPVKTESADTTDVQKTLDDARDKRLNTEPTDPQTNQKEAQGSDSHGDSVRSMNNVVMDLMSTGNNSTVQKASHLWRAPPAGQTWRPCETPSTFRSSTVNAQALYSHGSRQDEAGLGQGQQNSKAEYPNDDMTIQQRKPSLWSKPN